MFACCVVGSWGREIGTKQAKIVPKSSKIVQKPPTSGPKWSTNREKSVKISFGGSFGAGSLPRRTPLFGTMPFSIKFYRFFCFWNLLFLLYFLLEAQSSMIYRVEWSGRENGIFSEQIRRFSVLINARKKVRAYAPKNVDLC